MAEGVTHEARPYQVQLLEAATEKNTIVLLGTGAGKTFIAVMLIKQLSAPTFAPFSEYEAKRTVFLVNTVPLVTQQSEYIEKHTPLIVGKYWGEMGVDDWSNDRWTDEFNDHNILVMTRQIFLDALCHGFVHISKINLIVFDECHHAVKKDPYVRIMKEFYFKCSPHNRPHILGLSASIISGKCKSGDLKKKLRDLEVTLDCRTETASDLAEVAKYATNPDEVLLPYGARPADCKVLPLRCDIESLVQFLNECSTLKEYEWVTDIRNVVEECLGVLDGVSVSSAIEAAKHSKEELQELQGEDLTKWEEGLVTASLTTITIFTQQCQQALDDGADDHSPKLTELLGVLCNAVYKWEENLCGIVFVQTRSTAVCLSNMINSLSKFMFPQIRCDYVVGHGAIQKTFGGSNMNVKKQQLVLKKFRNETINLLIATSVVEEGLDVRKCNLVVRYDFPQTFQSYVQSKGRARSSNSRYLLLVDESSYISCRAKLNGYRNIELELQSICHNRSVPNEDEIEERLMGQYPPFMPLGPDGPRLTVDGSLSLLHKYCQKLPHDQFTVSSPIFHHKTVEGGGFCHIDGEWYDDMYIVTVGFPMNCPIKDEVKGPALPSFKLAEKAAALLAIEMLHRRGELDDHLKPISHKDVDSDDEDEEKMTSKMRHNVGTTKTNMYYRNEVPECLKNSQPAVGPSQCTLYVFQLTSKDTGHYYRHNHYTPTVQTIGLLSSKPLPYHKVPKFSLFIGRTEVSVTIFKQPFDIVSDEQLELYQCFHNALFTKVLKMNKFEVSFNECGDVSRGYLVVPVSLVSGMDQPFCHVDDEILQHIIKHGDNIGQEPTCGPWALKDFCNALVSKNYTAELARGQTRLYEVLGVNQQVTPLSVFSHNNQSITYAQYFADKYHCQIQDPNQFSIICKPVSNSEKSLQLTATRFKDGADLDDPHSGEIRLFPELCKLHPIKADTLFLFRCIPSLLYRFESLLLLDEFGNDIISKTGIGLTPCKATLITTATTVPADHQEEDSSACYIIGVDSKPTIIDLMQTEAGVPRAPNAGLLLQACTAASADDCVDLERLEVLGDSFLKLAASVNLFCSRNRDHEGKLSMARSRRISNFNLWYLARKNGIPGKILSQKFSPLSSWVPPCFTPLDIEGPSEVAPLEMRDQKRCLYHKVSDKGVADTVEALLGACIVAGGLDGGFRFLKFIGLKLDYPAEESDAGRQDVTMQQVDSSSQESLMSLDCNQLTIINPLLIQNSMGILPQYCHTPPPSLLKEGDQIKQVLKAMPINCSLINDKLQWKFRDKALLLQALSHPSYNKNDLTECYQRLEFLGDAVLDYLITCYIYENFPDYSPGKITEMRSALVNNLAFAELAVRDLELHKLLLHTSPALFRQIEEYVNWLEMVWKRDEEESKSVALCKSMTYETKPCETTSTDEMLVESTIDEFPCMSLEGSVYFEEKALVDEDTIEEVEEIDPPKALGDVLESVAGALFLDSGMSLETVWIKFYPFFRPLIEKYSNKGLPIPPVKELYDTGHAVEMDTDSESRDGSKRFRCTVRVVDKRIQVSAVAKTKKVAQKAAAKRALNILKREEPN